MESFGDGNRGGRGRGRKQTARRSRPFNGPGHRGGRDQHTGPRDYDDPVFLMTGLAIAQPEEDYGSDGDSEVIQTFMRERMSAEQQRNAAALARLPKLVQPTGPALNVDTVAGGAITVAHDDPRIEAMGIGFPVSVHPLRLPNTRAHFATGASIVDFRFVRIAGLLHKMVPLRKGVDHVSIGTMAAGSQLRAYGRLRLVFDAQGYEFEHQFWVTDIGFPVELQLGGDFMTEHGLTTRMGDSHWIIEKADAKKVRKLVDVYATE
ncbi:hypothetical protein EIP91_011291 [Steccherinum ochraceum]|uniref:Uncharacterized protein n=1 Tax=Steccherinum ochraceum TaxID=92696 RepID=A0A4R0R513_9APHY|nr:hypothetical protein EIP91_011291 [Steccherinum ochraceum]